jgi:TnpA family transposase
MWLCSRSTSIIEDRDLSTHLNVLTTREDILRRFTRNNVQPPTYQALAELGRACKTIFLCRYLGSLALRHQIQETLNVIEHWNNEG